MVKVCVVTWCKPQTLTLTVKCLHCIAVYCVHTPYSYILPISKSPCTLVCYQSNIEGPWLRPLGPPPA